MVATEYNYMYNGNTQPVSFRPSIRKSASNKPRELEHDGKSVGNRHKIDRCVFIFRLLIDHLQPTTLHHAFSKTSDRNNRLSMTYRSKRSCKPPIDSFKTERPLNGEWRDKT